MVTYGPWVQDPDFDGSPAVSFTTNAWSAGHETPFQEPAYAITNADLEDAFDAARAGALVGSHAPLFLSEWGVNIAWGYELSLPNVRSSWAAEVNRRHVAFGPGVHPYNPPNYGFLAPPGAIGLDFEANPYDPEGYPWGDAPGTVTGLRLLPTTRFAGFWDDTSQPPDYSLEGPPPTLLRLQHGIDFRETLATLTPPSNPTPDLGTAIYQFLDETIDLTPYVEDDGWTGSLWTDTDVFYPPKVDPSVGDGLVRYGWGLSNIHIVATVRPPLYRWVFEGTPYRRTSHRNDAVAGGAGRNFPRSKSVQSSNRTSAGHF